MTSVIMQKLLLMTNDLVLLNKKKIINRFWFEKKKFRHGESNPDPVDENHVS